MRRADCETRAIVTPRQRPRAPPPRTCGSAIQQQVAHFEEYRCGPGAVCQARALAHCFSAVGSPLALTAQWRFYNVQEKMKGGANF